MRLIPLLALALGCAKELPSPDVRVTEVDLRLDDVVVDEVDLEEARGRLVFDYVNPFEEPAVLEAVDWTLQIAGESDLQSRAMRQAVSLPAEQDGRFALDLVVPWTSIDEALGAYPERDALSWHLTGTARLQTPKGLREVPFTDSGELPVLHPPKLTLDEVRMRSLDLQAQTGTADLVFVVGSRQLSELRDLTYDVSFDGVTVAEGTRRRAFDLREDRWILPVNLDLSAVQPETLRQLRLEGEVQADVHLRGEVETVHGSVPLDLIRTGAADVVGRPVI